MKTEPHTKTQSHEENPPQGSTPTISHLRASTPPRESFSTHSVSLDSLAPARLALRANLRLLHLAFPKRSVVVKSSAFSLVELLVVMAIIGMMVGLSAMAVQGMRAPAVQHAASQVTSGLSLARQIAITKNTHAAFLIANQSNAGFPSEPFRYWSVIYSNKGTNTWTIAKDWQELPNGAVFYEIRGATGPTPLIVYNSINSNNFASGIEPGSTIPTTNFTYGNSTGNYTVANAGGIEINRVPRILFKSSGEATNANATGIAIRIVPGSVMGGNATITSTNQYFFVETDAAVGRIRMRSPESYK
jgi:prepilin-type N-terminal cleavage/methylation domain-containing protein